MIEQITTQSPNILAFKLSGTLHDDDYARFVPVIDAAVEAHGKVRIVAELVDFHGWDVHAIWDDIKFAAGHYSSIERIAIIGDRKWEEMMATVCKPFTHATIQYFDESASDTAWSWIEQENAG
jgi:hypothetical protein